MSGPHPRATGTLLAEFERWRPHFNPSPLRWWQRLVAARILEVDDAGDLVWQTVLISTARQVGKSWIVRELILFLIQQEARWGEVRDCLFISRDEKAAKEIARPAQLWVKRERQPGWGIRQGNGENEVSHFGSRWLVRSKDAIYGYSASFVVADEAWSLAAGIVEEGVEPTLVERRSSQLVLISTAHRSATRLMRDRRKAAIAELDDPGNTLLLEWSAPSDARLDDEAGWRSASPHWSPRREELIRSRVTAALDGTLEPDLDEPDPASYVACQWLNRWPEAVAARQPGVSLVGEAVWDHLRQPGLHVPEEPIVAAVEAVTGHPAAVAVAWRMPDERIAVIARTVPSIEAAWAALGAMPAGSDFLCGLSWRSHVRAQDLGCEGVGTRETEQALPVLADLVVAGRLAWDGDLLGEQVRALRVVDSSSSSGKTMVRSATQTHLARAAAWAVWRIDQTAAGPVIW